MMFDKRTNRAIFLFLVFLNLTLRYFLLNNHEEGSDSFTIHNLSNVITNFGYAKWIIHPLSYFGLTPLSYPCAVPYIISGISQLTGLDMEHSILILSFTSAIIALSSAYLMAMELKRDHLFAMMVSFVYSLSPIFVELTLWQATTRSLFLAFLPLLVWALLRTHGNRSDKSVNILLCIMIFTVLGTIHHMFLLLPLFLIAYFSSHFIYNSIKKKSLKEHWIYRYQTPIITTVFLSLLLPQFSQRGIYSTVSWKTYETGLFFSGQETYILLLNMIIDYWSRTGFFAFIGILGFFVLIKRPRKRIKDIFQRYRLEKTYNEIFIILCLIVTIPFVTMGVYVSLIFLPFFSIVIGLGIVTLFRLVRHHKQLFITLFVTFILISLGYTVFMSNHWNRQITNQPISEQTYVASIYVHIHCENTSIGNNGLISNRISAISNYPALPLGGAHAAWYPPELLIYGFADVEDYTFKRLNFDVVILTQSDYLYTTEYGVNAKDDWHIMMRTPVDDPKIDQLNTRYNIEQVVEYLPQEKLYFFWTLRDSKFLETVDGKKYVIYDNGELRIWHL